MIIKQPVHIHEPDGAVKAPLELIEPDEPGGVVIPFVGGADFGADTYVGGPLTYFGGIEDMKMAGDIGGDGLKAPDHGEGEGKVSSVAGQPDDGAAEYEILVKAGGRQIESFVFKARGVVEIWLKPRRACHVRLGFKQPEQLFRQCPITLT